MLAEKHFTFLLASREPALLRAMEPVIAALGCHAEFVLTAESALASLTAPHPPILAIFDAKLPATEDGMGIDELLTLVRTGIGTRLLPVVLIDDSVKQQTMSWLVEGRIDDVLLRSSEPSYWRLRLDSLLRAVETARQLEGLREAAALHAETDRLTGIFNRETLLNILYRETDRVQRTKSPMCLILFDIDDFGHWNSRLGSDNCDELLRQVVARTNRVLRSYDLFGRPGMDEFLIALPGCTPANALLMAERLRVDVFSQPFHLDGEYIRLSACFGVALSHGRTPVVVLREAEQALIEARQAGPESIRCFQGEPHPVPAPVAFLSPGSGDELLAW